MPFSIEREINMFYAICEGVPGSSGPAYVIYKFNFLENIKKCDAVNEYSIVYNGVSPQQLVEFCSVEELHEIAVAIGGDLTYVSHQQAADYVHQAVVKKAKYWKPQEESDMSTIHVDQFNNKAQKHEATEKKKQVRTRFRNDARIIVLKDTPTVREGTNRFRNMKVIMESATVGEAIAKLRALTPAPGSGVDIRIACEAGVIKLDWQEE